MTTLFNDSSRTPRAYSSLRSIEACPLNTTGVSPVTRCMYMGHFVLILIFAYCLNSFLVVKLQQGEYDVTEKWHTYIAFELWPWRRLFFFHLFWLVGGQLLYSIVVVFAMHWHESAMDLHVFPIPIPPPSSLSIPSLWVFPVYQPWALFSCIQPGLVICLTLDSILVSKLFSQNIPPSPTLTESKILFYTSVSIFLFCI